MLGSSSSNGGGRRRRDWAALQEDVLFYIAGKLTIFDYVTFRAVCRSWLAAVPEIPHAPYLLLAPARDRDRREETGLFTFLSLPDNTLHRFRIPKLDGKYCVGSQYGWLATIDRRKHELALLNPFTGQDIPLPSLTTLSDRHPYGSIPYSSFFIAQQCCSIAVTTVALSSDPADGTAFTVAALLGFSSLPRKLIFTRAGEEEEEEEASWNFYQPQENLDFQDVTFDPRGRLLGIATGVTDCLLVEIDVVGSRGTRTFHFHNLHVATHHLLPDDAGGGLPLCVGRKHGIGSCHTTDVHIFKAAVSDGHAQEHCEMMTKERTGLDGRAFFVGTGPSLLLSAVDVRRLKLEANRVYFTDVWWMLLKKGFGYGIDSGIFNWEDQTISPLVKRGAKCSSCGDEITCRHGPAPFDWFPPVWITPSVRRRPIA